MPTYEYTCKQCGHTFDVVQSMRDDALTVCPVCGGELRKVFHAAAIAFKGSGFYATDNRKKGSGGGSSSERSEKSEKSDRSEGSDKSEKSEKSERSEKSEKSEKSERSEKSDAPASPKKETKPADTSSSGSEPKKGSTT
jgi:putative FmdB family regulatory protein